MDSDATARAFGSLLNFVLLLLLLSVGFTLAQVLVLRQFGARAAWGFCALLTVALVAVGIAGILQISPEAALPLGSMLYITTAFIGTPLALATLFIVRSARRPDRSGFRHGVMGWAGFWLGVICGAILGVIPDFVRLLGQS